VEALGSQRREDSPPSGHFLNTLPTDAAGEDAGEPAPPSQDRVANDTASLTTNPDASLADGETGVGSTGHRRPFWRTCLIFWLRWVQVSMEKSVLLWLWTGAILLDSVRERMRMTDWISVGRLTAILFGGLFVLSGLEDLIRNACKMGIDTLN
jgi:hypothetical protein